MVLVLATGPTHAGAGAASAYLTPVLAALLAGISLGEAITSAVLIGGVSVAAGVYLVNRA